MKHYYFISALLIISFLLPACKKKDDITSLYKEWYRKEIIFPPDLIFTQFTTDTVPSLLNKESYKIVIYTNREGCTSCKLQLSKWKSLMQELNESSISTVEFIFVFSSDDRKEIHSILKANAFNHPICLDSEDKLNALNQFPRDERFHTFLLDKENKVSLIGNPIQNLGIKELYKKELNK